VSSTSCEARDAQIHHFGTRSQPETALEVGRFLTACFTFGAVTAQRSPISARIRQNVLLACFYMNWRETRWPMLNKDAGPK
jgi:hypothetical protein